MLQILQTYFKNLHFKLEFHEMPLQDWRVLWHIVRSCFWQSHTSSQIYSSDVTVQASGFLALTWRGSVYVDGGVEFWTSLVQVNDGLYRQRSGAFCPIKSEVPALATSCLTLQPEWATEQHTESTVCMLLSERTLLRTGTQEELMSLTPGSQHTCSKEAHKPYVYCRKKYCGSTAYGDCISIVFFTI